MNFLDPAGGYFNQYVTQASQELLGFVFHDHVYVYTTPPFGWQNSGFFHQLIGKVCCRMYELFGGKITLCM